MNIFFPIDRKQNRKHNRLFWFWVFLLESCSLWFHSSATHNQSIFKLNPSSINVRSVCLITSTLKRLQNTCWGQTERTLSLTVWPWAKLLKLSLLSSPHLQNEQWYWRHRIISRTKYWEPIPQQTYTDSFPSYSSILGSPLKYWKELLMFPFSLYLRLKRHPMIIHVTLSTGNLNEMKLIKQSTFTNFPIQT